MITISSSDPEVEKYLIDYATKRGAKQNSVSEVRRSQNSPGTVVQSFSIATPQRTIAGTGRSFGGSPNPPFLLPFLTAPSMEGFDFNNWFRNIEPFYDPSFSNHGAGGVGASATVVNDNGRVYSKVESSHLRNRSR